MDKITLLFNLEENPRKSSIFNILNEKNKLRPEVIELIEEAITKYFNAPITKGKIKIKDHNEQLTITVGGKIEHIQERWQ